MYLISQFSKITGLTVKTLRYYDEQDILKPSFRDSENLYRYYDNNDLIKAELINKLRSLDFSIAEIKETLELVKTKDDLMFILQEKTRQIEENIKIQQERIQLIIQQLESTTNNSSLQNYEITFEDIDPVFAATIRFKGKYTDLDHYVPLLYKTVKGAATGSHFNCYYDEECLETADIELCIPIKKQISDKLIECKIIPSIHALCTIHNGSYETINQAYKELFKYANEHNIRLTNPSREVYLKGPGMIFKGNPHNYMTKIIFPVLLKVGE